MKKYYLFLTIFIILFFTLIPIASAIECEYDDWGLKITYDKDNTSINSEFVRREKYKNYFVYKTIHTNEATERINIDQTLYEKYQGATCPTKMKVCAETDYSINVPTIKNTGALVVYSALNALDFGAETLDAIFNGSIALINLLPFVNIDAKSDLSSIITEELTNAWGKEAYAVITLNNRTLHIYTEEEYKKSDIYGKKDGLYMDSFEIWGNELAAHCEGDRCSVWWSAILNFIGTNWATNWELLKRFVVGDIALIGYRNIKCATVDYTGEYNVVDINCEFLKTGMFKYQDYINEYKECSNKECKGQKLKKIHNQETIIKKNCNNVLANYTYNETQNSCMQSCFNLRSELNEKRKGTDLYEDLSESKNAKCSLSARLVNWIMKFINWMRYIVPVLLIILSVLDYIKAIAADSEDEVKKVTGKFVKRLIVSVCIFLVPLALDFLLGIFGINANNFCL